MKLYAVQAHVAWSNSDGTSGSRQLPTFYLHPAVQGILSAEHAALVAGDLIDQVWEATCAANGARAGAVVPHVHAEEVEVP